MDKIINVNFYLEDFVTELFDKDKFYNVIDEIKAFMKSDMEFTKITIENTYDSVTGEKNNKEQLEGC